MTIVSIDNMEGDGLVNLTGFLESLNRQNATDPLRQHLVAIVPEFRTDNGRLDRLNCVTVDATDPGSLAHGLSALLDGGAQIIAFLKAQRRAALERANHAITVVRPTDPTVPVP